MKSQALAEVKALLEEELPDVPRETWERLLRHADLVMTWNPSINLTGAKDVVAFIQDQVLDCAKAYAALPKAKAYVDLGSGAGLPGLVWALLDPKPEMILVELLKKRAAFLNRAVAELGLSQVRVLNRSFSDLEVGTMPLELDIVSRGTWPPQELLPLAKQSKLLWKTWWIFSSEKLYQEYLKISPDYSIKVQKLDYPKSRGKFGLLTRLDRDI